VTGQAVAPSIRSETAHRADLLRIDWRVLLPLPSKGFEHLLLFGGTEAIAETIIATGIARRVSCTVPKERSADAAAILAGAEVGCEDVVSALLPGASLYWEIQRRLVGPGPRLRARLRRVGFSLTGVYWARPCFERCHQFIPLDVPEAMHWYLQLWADHSRWRDWVAAFLGIRRMAKAACRVARHQALTATLVPGPETSPSILEHPVLRAKIGDARARAIVFNRAGKDASRRVVLFAFQSGSREPAAVLKFSRLPERNGEVEEEQKVCQEIRLQLDFRMRKTIPAPLGTFRWGPVDVGVEEFARGRPLSSHRTSQRRRRTEDLRLVADWLREFHGQTRICGRGFTFRDVEAVLAAYVSGFGATPEETRLFERTRARVLSLRKPLPLVWSHTALSDWNVCRVRDEISVIDWEASGPGPPLRDLIYFVTVWHYRSGRRRGRDAQAASFEKLFLSHRPDAAAIQARSALRDYMRNLSLEPEAFPSMLVITWVLRALARRQRLQAFGDPDEDVRKNNLHVGFLQVLAANEARLFRGGIP
jgi:phosphotransferase family enzyme